MLSFIRHMFRGMSLVVLCALTIPFAVFACIVGGFIFLPLPAELPEAKTALPSEATKVFDIDGKEIANLQRFDQSIRIEKDDIPLVLKQALISSEDRNFYNHGGVDVRGTFRALYADLRNQGVVQGGSTITQQYVKKAYVGEERTITRKIREAVLASQLDRQTDKDEILYNYLDIVYLGDGAYGVGAASQSYFRKPVNELNVSEAATLVGVIPAPSARAPRDSLADSEFHRKLVLQQMLGEGYIDQATHDDAVNRPLWLEGTEKPSENVTTIYNRQESQSQFPYFTDYVERYLKARYGEDKVYAGGLRVQTTLSPELQAQAEKTVADELRGTSAPLDMAMVSVEPGTGYVKALVGGRDFAKAQVNLALGGCPPRPGTKEKPIPVQVEPTCWDPDAKTVSGGGTGRQPGSSFKPYVLAAAYENGIGPSTVYPAPSFWSPPGCRGQSCVIGNYEGSAGGSANLKVSMAKSYNTVFSPLIRDIGTKRTGKAVDGFIQTAEMAKKLGVTSSYYAEGFHQVGGQYALGTIDVSPLDMAASYAVFANRGLKQSATPVVKVIDRDGNVLEDNTAREPERVLEEAVADNVNDTLLSVVETGTARQNGQIGRPAAGKTGTTDNYTNAWFVGYTPTLSTSVWMGYSDSSRKSIVYRGQGRIAGGSEPTKTWATFMKQALKDVEVTEFSQPAPIKAPVRDVLAPSGANSGSQVIRPAEARKIEGTPTGDFDRVERGQQPATPPTTAAPQ